ncbi:hypothetical protein GCM10027589_06740 [Actinocorallia lasiicapitis]
MLSGREADGARLAPEADCCSLARQGREGRAGSSETVGAVGHGRDPPTAPTLTRVRLASTTRGAHNLRTHPDAGAVLPNRGGGAAPDFFPGSVLHSANWLLLAWSA